MTETASVNVGEMRFPFPISFQLKIFLALASAVSPTLSMLSILSRPSSSILRTDCSDAWMTIGSLLAIPDKNTVELMTFEFESRYWFPVASQQMTIFFDSGICS